MNPATRLESTSPRVPSTSSQPFEIFLSPMNRPAEIRRISYRGRCSNWGLFGDHVEAPWRRRTSRPPDRTSRIAGGSSKRGGVAMRMLIELAHWRFNKKLVDRPFCSSMLRTSACYKDSTGRPASVSLELVVRWLR